jgi:hypothetical protein
VIEIIHGEHFGLIQGKICLPSFKKKFTMIAEQKKIIGSVERPANPET